MQRHSQSRQITKIQATSGLVFCGEAYRFEAETQTCCLLSTLFGEFKKLQ